VAAHRLQLAYDAGEQSFSTVYFLGSAYYGLQDYYKAVDMFEAARKQDSVNVNLHYYLGKSLMSTGQFKKSVQMLERGLELLTPSDSVLFNFHNSLAVTYSRWNKTTTAIRELDTCHKLKPEHVMTIYTIASLYDYNLKDYAKAKRYYQMFLNTFPPETQNDLSSSESVTNASYYKAVTHRLEEFKTDEFFQKGKE
ncbi:MAG: tetratricopeptide repeat protein, partial [Chryseobacterium sp.]